MAAPDNYVFTVLEVLEGWIKLAGVHEGEWTINLQFGLNAGNLGPADAQVPAAFVSVAKFGICRATETTPACLKLDAAKIWGLMPTRQDLN